jgi:hypothetical protein
MRPFAISKAWAEKIQEEFKQQSQSEAQFNLPRSFPIGSLDNLAKMQIGFIEYIVNPLVYSVKELIPELDETIENLNNNKIVWKMIDQDRLSPNRVNSPFANEFLLYKVPSKSGSTLMRSHSNSNLTDYEENIQKAKARGRRNTINGCDKTEIIEKVNERLTTLLQPHEDPGLKAVLSHSSSKSYSRAVSSVHFEDGKTFESRQNSRLPSRQNSTLMKFVSGHNSRPMSRQGSKGSELMEDRNEKEFKTEQLKDYLSGMELAFRLSSDKIKDGFTPKMPIPTRLWSMPDKSRSNSSKDRQRTETNKP